MCRLVCLFVVHIQQHEGQVALDLSPELCLSFYIYRYQLEIGHVPGDAWGEDFMAPGPKFEQIQKGTQDDAIY